MTYKTLCLTIDEDLRGDLMMPVTDELHKLGIQATIFIDFRSRISKKYIERLKAQGHSLQMHWIRFPIRTKRSFYLKKEVDLAEQKLIIEKIIGQSIIGNRTHGLDWHAPFPRESDDDFVYPWKKMKEAGLQWSSSVAGFPTPFVAKDLAGQPLMLEMPITHFERIPDTEDELIVALVHPHYNVWKSIVDWGLEHNYEFITMTKLASLVNGKHIKLE